MDIHMHVRRTKQSKSEAKSAETSRLREPQLQRLPQRPARAERERVGGLHVRERLDELQAGFGGEGGEGGVLAEVGAAEKRREQEGGARKREGWEGAAAGVGPVGQGGRGQAAALLLPGASWNSGG